MNLFYEICSHSRRLEAERVRDRAEQLRGREARVDQPDHRTRIADPIDQRARQRGFARTDLADEHRQFLLVHRIFEPRERLGMLRTLIEKTRIGSFPEWLGGEAEEILKHWPMRAPLSRVRRRPRSARRHRSPARSPLFQLRSRRRYQEFP